MYQVNYGDPIVHALELLISLVGEDYENDLFLLSSAGNDLGEPNWWYKSENIQAEWYHHPGRGMWISHELTPFEIIEIFIQCYNSIDLNGLPEESFVWEYEESEDDD